MKRFYCENCGAEVQEDATLCPECGAFFVAIKCPKCGYRGKSHEFGRGCPRCGYLGDPPDEHQGSEDQKDARYRLRYGFARQFTMHRDATDPVRLPSWFFWLVLAILAGSFAILAQIYAGL